MKTGQEQETYMEYKMPFAFTYMYFITVEDLVHDHTFVRVRDVTSDGKY